VSDLLYKANVLERRSTNTMYVVNEAWKTTLAVSTVNGLLHVFDIPSNHERIKVTKGTAPEVAFRKMIPPVELPSEAQLKQNQSPSNIRWYHHLIPSESFVISNCAIEFYDAVGSKNCQFEIQEAVEATGANKIFGKKIVYRKLLFRTVSRDEAVVWLSSLKGCNIKWTPNDTL